MNNNSSENQFKLAIKVWILFIILAVLINGTILFALGYDLHNWTYSIYKGFLFYEVIYIALFLIVPLILVKGWETVKKADFLIPLIIIVVAITLIRPFTPFAAALMVVLLLYLHYRFDLSSLGIRSLGWKGDLIAILFLVFIGFLPSLLQGHLHSPALLNGISGGLERMFANPASTVENLFYFGFLTERISFKTGEWTPLIIGGMYTLHEMTNPEYWYSGTNFAIIFVGIAIFTAVYLWRRSVVVIWLGDGLSRFLSNFI
ncbi:MAG: hypothetical protein ACXVHT_04715 [Methanobacterium sp.]